MIDRAVSVAVVEHQVPRLEVAGRRSASSSSPPCRPRSVARAPTPRTAAAGRPSSCCCRRRGGATRRTRSSRTRNAVGRRAPPAPAWTDPIRRPRRRGNRRSGPPLDDAEHPRSEVRQLDVRVLSQEVADAPGRLGRRAPERIRDLGPRHQVGRTDVHRLRSRSARCSAGPSACPGASCRSSSGRGRWHPTGCGCG